MYEPDWRTSEKKYMTSFLKDVEDDNITSIHTVYDAIRGRTMTGVLTKYNTHYIIDVRPGKVRDLLSPN